MKTRSQTRQSVNVTSSHIESPEKASEDVTISEDEVMDDPLNITFLGHNLKVSTMDGGNEEHLNQILQVLERTERKLIRDCEIKRSNDFERIERLKEKLLSDVDGLPEHIKNSPMEKTMPQVALPMLRNLPSCVTGRSMLPLIRVGRVLSKHAQTEDNIRVWDDSYDSLTREVMDKIKRN